MASKTKMLGAIGEQVVIAEFIKAGAQVSVPVGDNAPYDMIVDMHGKMLKVQVKSTEKAKQGVMNFSTCITDPYKLTRTKYTSEMIDVFALFCLENGYIGLIKVEDCGESLKLRTDAPKNGQKKNIKMGKDYEFHLTISEL